MVKEALNHKYKELEESKPILKVLENYMTYRKKIDEVMMGRARLSSDEYGEEEKMRIGVKEINMGAIADRFQRLKGLEAGESVVDDEEGIWSTKVTGGDQSDVLTYGQVDGVSSWLINETTIETLFGVKFTSLSDIDAFSNSIKEEKYADILSPMSTADINAAVNAIETIERKFQVVLDSHVIRQDHAFLSDHIVQSVDIITKSTSYAGATGASTKEQPNVSSNFRPLVADPVFNGVNILIPRKVVEKAGLEAVLESGPWMIRKTLIILKKWSMSTSLQKEELMRIPIWVKLHDDLLQVFEEDEADLVDVVTIGIPSLMGDEFTKETIRVEYGYIKNHKKTVKNEQARTRESEEYKKKPKIQAEAKKVKPQSNPVKMVKNWSTKVNQ
ncbi:zinc knuckle CX2CX4HX4C containing protein [Tanacetum coccineum]